MGKRRQTRRAHPIGLHFPSPGFDPVKAALLNSAFQIQYLIVSALI